MKQFVEPQVTVEDLQVEDIVTTSVEPTSGDWGTGEGGL